MFRRLNMATPTRAKTCRGAPASIQATMRPFSSLQCHHNQRAQIFQRAWKMIFVFRRIRASRAIPDHHRPAPQRVLLLPATSTNISHFRRTRCPSHLISPIIRNTLRLHKPRRQVRMLRRPVPCTIRARPILHMRFPAFLSTIHLQTLELAWRGHRHQHCRVTSHISLRPTNPRCPLSLLPNHRIVKAQYLTAPINRPMRHVTRLLWRQMPGHRLGLPTTLKQADRWQRSTCRPSHMSRQRPHNLHRRL